MRSRRARPDAKRGTAREPSRSLPEGIAARQSAVRILGSVLDRRQPLDRAIELERAGLDVLDPRDRGFALTIVRAVLRRLRFLDAVLSRLIERPLPAEAQRVRLILLAGAAQVLLLETPPHAAVNIAVEQCRHDRITGRFAKLVNAVMRRVPAAGSSVADTWDSPRADIPDWLFERWSRAYGDAVARRIAAASLERAALDITVREQPEVWAARLGATLLSTGSLRLADAGVVPDLPGYAEDAWWVQDAAAALPARLLGAVGGQSIADLCAAPGGKTAQLAAQGAHVTAVDGSKNRLQRLGENMARLGLGGNVTVVAADIEAFRSETEFDAVLLDAPCSATGTIRRHPDILHLKAPDDIARLAQLQARLLARAGSLVRSGGLLVYCTCSLEPEEGPEQIARFLGEAGNFERVPIAPEEIGGDASWLTTAGELRTLPFHAAGSFPEAQGLDGFFAARLRRVR